MRGLSFIITSNIMNSQFIIKHDDDTTGTRCLSHLLMI